MIDKIQIKNFKSIHDIEMEPGRFNILIGENGSGKSNILEGIAFLGAYIAGKVDNEFLYSRGIRIPEVNLFKSAFSQSTLKRPIEFSLWADNKMLIEKLKLNYYNKKWQSVEEIAFEKKGSLENIADKKLFQKNINFSQSLTAIMNHVSKIEDKNKKVEILQTFKKQLDEIIEKSEVNEILNILIYSPETTSLRNFSEEGQILPIGIKGEGLFKEVKRLSEKKNKKQIKLVFEALKLLDWFYNFEIPSKSFGRESVIKISDRYLKNKLSFLDQRSVNEGFLLLLFYVTIIVSENTPSFIAIDNIDSSLNPKLCTQFIKLLNSLSKTYNKRLILTTHNPFILDGLDLLDDSQRLFVIRRDINGHTISNRIKPEKPLSYKLSEAWMNGFIGGLANNF